MCVPGMGSEDAGIIGDGPEVTVSVSEAMRGSDVRDFIAALKGVNQPPGVKPVFPVKG